MYKIFFLIILFSCTFAYYSDKLDKQTKLGPLIIGTMLSIVTGFPKLIVFISNSENLINIVLNNNIFSLFLITLLDIIFFNKRIMNKISKKYIYLIFILIYLSIIINISIGNIKNLFFNIGFPTIIIFLSYIIFIFLSFKLTINNNDDKKYNRINNLKPKFIVNILILLMLTIFVKTMDYKALYFLSYIYILNIIISLILIILENYNLFFSYIIGNIIFNFMILSITDLFTISDTIYNKFNIITLLLSKMFIYITFISLIYVLRDKITNKIIYSIPSVLIILMCLYIFLVQFIYIV